VLIKFKPKSSLKQDIYGRDPLTANVNISIASAVTAYARIYMDKFKDPNFLEKLGIKLLYTDTDSLYFDGPLPSEFVDPTKLGALKLEGIYDQSLFLAPKVYALKNKDEEIIKIKGLTKDAIKQNNITFEILATLLSEDYKLTFNQNKWFKSFEKANIQILEQIYTLKVTSLKRNLIYEDGKLVNTRPIIIQE
jgi:DNA polymerase elongation subunit (family B)